MAYSFKNKSDFIARIAASAAALLLHTVSARAAEAEFANSATTSEAADRYRFFGDDLRLATVGYRLAVSNPDACSDPDIYTGMMVQDISNYAAADREDAAQLWGIGEGFTVTGVVAGSAAEQSGLSTGDEIVAVNGKDVASAFPIIHSSSSSYLRIEKFTDYLSAALWNGPVEISVVREGRRLDLRMTGLRGCGGRFALMRSNVLNAWSDGKYVAVTTRMLQTTADDDELAFVIGHEMAHNILGHAKKLRGKSALLASFGFGAGAFRRTEAEADQLAITLIASSRVDLSAPARILIRTRAGLAEAFATTHPTTRQRVELINTAIAKLEAAQGEIFAFSSTSSSLSLVSVSSYRTWFQRSFAAERLSLAPETSDDGGSAVGITLRQYSGLQYQSASKNGIAMLDVDVGLRDYLQKIGKV